MAKLQTTVETRQETLEQFKERVGPLRENLFCRYPHYRRADRRCERLFRAKMIRDGERPPADFFPDRPEEDRIMYWMEQTRPRREILDWLRGERALTGMPLAWVAADEVVADARQLLWPTSAAPL
jgi:hypothetical protein